jgi:hypothetical protein
VLFTNRKNWEEKRWKEIGEEHNKQNVADRYYQPVSQKVKISLSYDCLPDSMDYLPSGEGNFFDYIHIHNKNSQSA